MEMEDQYAMADLRQYINGRAHFPAIPPSGDLFSGQPRNLTQAQHHHHYDMILVGRHQVGADHMVPPRGRLHQHEFGSDSTTTAAAAAAVSGATCAAAAAASSGSLNNGLEMESGGGGFGGDGGTGRWPRQETLTLLEIRSRLDSKFKEANHKGPLWDEISRIMYEENGYQRSGKKCREKFENLYKYYKKTKEGKAGRQDGKHYRFFRQLEALYGDTNHPTSVSETHFVGNNFLFHNPSNTLQGNQEPFQAPKLSDSLSNPSDEFDSSSSDDNEINEAGLMDTDSTEKKKKRRGRRSWKAKIRDFIDLQMRKLMEKQEEWLEKMSNTLERKEQERMMREEEWRKQEEARIERQHKLWAKERAWIEARNASLIEALQKLTGKEIPSLNENQNDGWSECEITKLIQLRTSMESRFEQSDHGSSEEALWEEIAAKMAYLGYERSSSMCKEKWDRTSIYLRRTKECNKMRRENNSRTCCYFQNNNEPILYNIHQAGGGAYCEMNAPIDGGGASPYFFIGADHQAGDNLWNNYGDKLSKGGSH